MAVGSLIVAGIIAGIIYLFYRDYKKLNTIYIDRYGYERNGYNRLVHRDIAYEHIYKEGYTNGVFTERFGDYVIHHKDENKRNNSLDNLQILTREQHEAIHQKSRL